jgi:glutaredoxin
MEQQRCTILNLYVNWTIFFAGATFFLITERYLLLAAWLLGAPVFQVAYVLAFPRLSHALGYGSVADEAAPAPQPAPVNVTLYTAIGCPFCPIIEQRLESLKATMGFTLTKVDVTMRPDILAAKKIKGVPVVEVGGLLRTGNLTSRELADTIAAGGAPTA